jgi:hypothetical protein
MKNLKKLVLTGIAGMIAATSFGQSEFTLSGEYRPRAEYRHGYKSVADSNQQNAFYIDQRTRLKLNYKVKDYEFYISVQDIRTWGANAQLNVSDGFMSIHQAWAKANFNENWGIKLGRQELNYDDARILGNVAWLQQARSHDAAVIQWQTEKSKLHIGAAFNQEGMPMVGTDYPSTLNPAATYRDMHYAWFNTKFGEKVNMSLLAMNLGKQITVINTEGNNHKSMHYILTAGTHTKFNFGKFKAVLNGYYQFGSAFTTPQSDHGAYLLGLDLNYQVAKTFSVGLGYETQSGRTQTDTSSAYLGASQAFNPFFGTNHKFNGLIDYFYVGNGHGNVGLQDAYLKLNFKKGIWSAGLNVHMFMTGLGVDVYDATRYNTALGAATTQAEIDAIQAGQYTDYTLGNMLGTEIDFSFGTKINKSVAVKAGYSHMLASETLATLKGVTYTSGADAGLGRTDQMNNWGYVMVIIKPTFLNIKKEEKKD